jgi:hypothetical protein
MNEKKNEQINSSEVSNQMKLIRKLHEKKLSISRIPEKTKKEFVELANSEFCGDYGMCLKFLMDGIPKGDIKDILIKIMEIEERLIKLESLKSVGGEKRVIKMLDKTERRLN